MVTLLKSSLVNERWGQRFANQIYQLPYIVDVVDGVDSDTTTVNIPFTTSSLNYGYLIVVFVCRVAAPSTLTWNSQTLTRLNVAIVGNEAAAIYYLSRPGAAASAITGDTGGAVTWALTAFTLENVSAGASGLLVNHGVGVQKSNTKDLPFSEWGITILSTAGQDADQQGFPINYYKPIGTGFHAWYAYTHNQHERSWYDNLMNDKAVNPDARTTGWVRASFNGIRSI